MDRTQIKKITFKHFRVPMAWAWAGNKKGRPQWCLAYSRKRGFDSEGTQDIGAPNPTGGVTECFVRLENGETLYGKTTCSMSDNFSYKAGRFISLLRAVQPLAI